MHEELSKLLEEKTIKQDNLRDSLHDITLQKNAFEGYIIMK
ncbi:16115_t:CDS:1, partial [Entrophospora sp. SA101]